MQLLAQFQICHGYSRCMISFLQPVGISSRVQNGAQFQGFPDHAIKFYEQHMLWVVQWEDSPFLRVLLLLVHNGHLVKYQNLHKTNGMIQHKIMSFFLKSQGAINNRHLNSLAKRTTLLMNFGRINCI